MKKLLVCVATVLMLMTFTPIQSKAERNPIPVSAAEKEAAELKALIKRVHEINAMDRSTMSRAERREIRKELHAIKKEIKRHSGGTVYISGGLLVLILVLIIVF
jgi:predicted transcriptional regulator